MARLKVNLLAAFLAFFTFFIYWNGSRVDLKESHQVNILFSELRTLHRELDVNILRSQSYALANFDPIVSDISQIKEKWLQLKILLESNRNSNAKLLNSLQEVESLIKHDAVLVEEFKSNLAGLKNSIFYLPHLLYEMDSVISKLSGSYDRDKIRLRISSILSRILIYTSRSALESKVDVEKDLRWLKDFEAQVARRSADLANLTSDAGLHIELILKKSDTISQVVSQILKADEIAKLTYAQRQYEGLQLEVESTSEVFRLSLIVFTLTLIGFMIHAMNRIYRSESTLKYLNQDLEQQVKLRTQQLLMNSKLASLGEMSAGIAHEINNPLAIISGASELLVKFSDNKPKLIQKVELIKKSCARIGKIVTGLKKFSRSDNIRKFSRHNLEDIAREALILTDSKARHSHIVVSSEVSMSGYIDCDEIEIEQVLVNLINNALDAVRDLPEKWVKLSIDVTDDNVVLRVTDSGVGIPLDIQEKIFQPFFTTKCVGEGTGLGLAICKGILTEHHASISILSESTNTSFEVKFPKAQEHSQAA